MHASRTGTTYAWIRQNVLGLVAIFIALSGSAVAAQVASQPGAQKAAKKKAKPGPRGPQGPAGSQGPTGTIGPQGPAGQNGSPDTAAQVLAKLITVDGAGSGLDSDLIDGINSQNIQRRGNTAFPTTGATPDVDGLSFAVFNNSSAQPITDLTGGDPGQILAIRTADANTTIADGGNFVLSADWNPNANDTLTLAFSGNVWHELARSAN